MTFGHRADVSCGVVDFDAGFRFFFSIVIYGVELAALTEEPSVQSFMLRLLGSGSSIGTLTFYVSDKPSLTFGPSLDCIYFEAVLCRRLSL
jgi:hypothetical protein